MTLKPKTTKKWVIYRIEKLSLGGETVTVLKYEACFDKEANAWKQAEYSLDVFPGAVTVLPVITNKLK